MLANARAGDRVELRYAASKREIVPLWAELHRQCGRVVIASRGKPRNHMIRLDSGRRFVVPCGNLMKL